MPSLLAKEDVASSSLVTRSLQVSHLLMSCESPFAPQNAVHGQINEMVVHPFRLSQYAFLLQTQTIADGLTWIVFRSDLRLEFGLTPTVEILR